MAGGTGLDGIGRGGVWVGEEGCGWAGRRGRKALRLQNTFITKNSAWHSCGLEVFLVGHLWRAVRPPACRGGGRDSGAVVVLSSGRLPGACRRLFVVPESKDSLALFVEY